jgi:hypothetical protein
MRGQDCFLTLGVQFSCQAKAVGVKRGCACVGGL